MHSLTIREVVDFLNKERNGRHEVKHGRPISAIWTAGVYGKESSLVLYATGVPMYPTFSLRRFEDHRFVVTSEQDSWARVEVVGISDGISHGHAYVPRYGWR
jgi:hypothetical protein